MPTALLIGSDHLGLRVAEQLLLEGYGVTALAPEGSWLASADLPDGVRRVVGPPEAAAALAEAGVASADILFALSGRDELNLGAALAAREANPSLRLVLRQFNVRLGRLLASELPKSAVVSMSALAAPTFALAALSPGVLFAHSFDEGTLVVREIDAPDGPLPEGTAVVARRLDEGPEWGPGEAPPDSTLLVASSADGLPEFPRPADGPARRRRAFDWHANRLFVGTVAYIVFVVASAAAFYEARLGLAPVDAFYFVVTTITSVGYGDFSLKEADALSKLVGMAVMLSGVSMTAVLFALVTNALIQRYEAHAHGRVRLRAAGHVVVCGLGVVGYRVAQDLKRRGRRVVVVERDEDGRFVAAARAEGIPVVIGDALDPETLLHASLGSARALIVCTNPDYLNLEIALHARSLMPSLPVVLRLFDPELARRVADVFRFRKTFSGAALAAPQIAAAGARDAALATLGFHELSVTLRRTRAREGESVGAVGRRAGGLPVAAITGGRLRCGPDPATLLGGADTVVTAHRAGGSSG